jgi:trehalose synthase
MQEVDIDPVPLDRLAGLLDAERAARLGEGTREAHRVLDGRMLWNINATASGGGVAEMLQTLLAYTLGAGVATRWLVLDGDHEFFAVTKRIHNLLHGSPGDGGELGDAQRAVYEDVLAHNHAALDELVSPGDVVLLHDPQTAGLAASLRARGVHVVWRSHIGRDETNEWTDLGWEFLRPYVEAAGATVFTRASYAPDWVDRSTMRVIPPSLDPFSTKNVDLDEASVAETLRMGGLVDLPEQADGLGFVRRDGSTGRVRPHASLFVDGERIPGDARYLMQVSRWDRLKDMGGVLTGFADHLGDFPDDVHLALVGPEVAGVSDDPEGAEVLAECIACWRKLPTAARRRIHLATLPMDDVDENAHLVNALQHRADLVVQKSLVEGFGLTVTEPMWKGRPVVASRVGGISDQIVDGESGLLLDEPTDLDAFARACVRVLTDDELAGRLGRAARERVRDRFLGDRHLVQYVELFSELLSGD